MSTPPNQIDGADVLCWAWSGAKPFGFVPVTGTTDAIPIYGLAVCRYPGSQKVYRFSCNFTWETEQDSEYDSVEEAISRLPGQYQQVEAHWIKVNKSP
jgi:hypothetical protein